MKSANDELVLAGSGPPLVLVPGIQGRWEWMRPAVRALAKRFRVITFSLTEDLEVSSDLPFDRQVEQVDGALYEAGVDQAVVCGVSYGGLIALRFAATHPARVAALVLVSTPSPTWRPDERLRRHIASPWMSAPAFFFGAPARLWREISAARPGWADRWRTAAGYLLTAAVNPPSPRVMARRARVVDACDFVADARAVSAATLVLTGEPDLDRVVPVGGTRQYLSLIRGSAGRTLERTGHIGLVTKAEEFAEAIAGFVAGVS